MNVLSIACRNVRRNGRRSVLTLLALAVGSAAIVMFGGYVNDTIQGLQTATVRQLGHLQIVPKNYFDFGRGDPKKYSISRYEDLIQRMRSDPELAPMLAVATPTLDVEGLAGNFAVGASSNFSGIGVVPSEHAKMLAWDGFHIGAAPTSSKLTEASPDTGVVGLGMAQLLRLCNGLRLNDCKREATTTSGDGEAIPADLAKLSDAASASAGNVAQTDVSKVAIELLAASPDGLPNVVRMKVAAAERQGIRQIDNMYVGMPLALAQRMLFGRGTRAASAIVVQLHSTDQLEAATRRINMIAASFGQHLDVLSFHEISPVYDQIVANYQSIFQFIAWLMGVVALFSVASAVNTSVNERTAEIGTLRALGFQRRNIRALFLTEGALLGLIGSVLGVVLAIGLADGVINLIGLSWTPPGRTSPIPIRSDIMATPALVWGTVLVMSAIACLSSLWPASSAAKLEVTEALRHA